jgi:PIN domain nuclease of toxin-antitoxin system
LTFAGVADTHAALWYVFDDRRLSERAKKFMERAARAQKKIAVSAISMVEIVYLIEKKRLPSAAYDDLLAALKDPDHVLMELPVGVGIAEAMRFVPRLAVPDMPDRIVAATAISLRVPVISRDGRIHASSLETIW